jgi:Protein of unknown function (DUF732)
MLTGTTSHSGALVTAIVVLTGAAILRGGAAAADSNQDDQFLALLDQEGIPALRGVPSLIATAHDVCRTLDAGMPAAGLVDAMVNNAFGIDPSEREYAPGRLARTEARFITAAVGAYCPYDRGKIASIGVNPTGWDEPTLRVTADMGKAVNSGSDLRESPPALAMISTPAAWQQPTGIGAVRLTFLMDGGVLVAGRCGDGRSGGDACGPVLASLTGSVPSAEIDDPNPPQLPAPPPPAAQIQTPRRPMAAPPPPKRPPPPPQQVEPPPQQPPPPPQQPPPPPQQPPPPPQQVEPPAVGPQPGGVAGGGGGGSTGGNGGGGNGSGSAGSNGGGGPADPSPGFVRLAP